jgi:hypothetical protein
MYNMSTQVLATLRQAVDRALVALKYLLERRVGVPHFHYTLCACR